MSSRAVYKEEIRWKSITIILTVVAGLMLAAFVYFAFYYEGAEAQVLTVTFGGAGIVFIFLAINFRKLKIEIYPEALEVGFGRFKKRYAMDNIRGCQPDDRSALRYGGFGIRLMIVKGKKVLVYNVISAPRVIVELDGRKFEEFVFSTNNPEQVIDVINKQVQGERFERSKD